MILKLYYKKKPVNIGGGGGEVKHHTHRVEYWILIGFKRNDKTILNRASVQSNIKRYCENVNFLE